MADRVGQQFGNYRLIRLLGQGSSAEVYLGEHVHLGTPAAIKILMTNLSSANLEKFRGEARLMARLKHAHIVRVLEFGVEASAPFLVAEYAPNGSLRQRHPKGTQLTPTFILPYIRQTADALQYLHNQRLIHRDVKPENLLLGPEHEVLVGDFGVAVFTQSIRQGETPGFAGTALYIAPEQIQHRPLPASDQYALGVMSYEWLCGRWPFEGTYLEVVSKHILTQPLPLRQHVPTLSPLVEQVVMTALAKDPVQRFASVQAFAHAFEQACQAAVARSSPHISTPSVQAPAWQVPTAPQSRYPVNDPLATKPAQKASPAVLQAPAAWQPVRSKPPRRGNRQVLIVLSAILVMAVIAGVVFFSLRLGANSPTPNRHGLQTNVPLPGNSSFVSMNTVPEGVGDTVDVWYWTVSSSEPTSVYQFYVDQLPNNGWRVVQTDNSSDPLSLSACQGNQALFMVMSQHLQDNDAQGTSTTTVDAPPGGSALGIALTSNPSLVQPLCQ